jgi:hypothetical protein
MEMGVKPMSGWNPTSGSGSFEKEENIGSQMGHSNKQNSFNIATIAAKIALPNFVTLIDLKMYSLPFHIFTFSNTFFAINIFV